MRHTQAGFTLAELTIVTVLVGLFVGGVLAGRSLVIQARIKLAVGEFNGIHAAHLHYQVDTRRCPVTTRGRPRAGRPARRMAPATAG